MDIIIKKLQQDIDTSLFRFYSDINKVKTTPVVNVVADVNLITVLYEALHSYDKDLYSKLADEKYFTQLEAASRIFYINKANELKSVFYTSDSLGSILDSNTLLHIEKEVIKLQISLILHPMGRPLLVFRFLSTLYFASKLVLVLTYFFLLLVIFIL